MLSLSKVSLGVSLLLSSVAIATADPKVGGDIVIDKWYCLYDEDQNFLSVDTTDSDETKHFLVGKFAGSAADVESGSDQGQRFQFPQGIPGLVKTQLHSVHYIGETGDTQGHWTSFGENQDAYGIANWHEDGKSIVIQHGQIGHIDYVSGGGLVTYRGFNWSYAEIDAVPS